MSVLRENPRVKFVIGLATSDNVGNLPKFNCGLPCFGWHFPTALFSDSPLLMRMVELVCPLLTTFEIGWSGQQPQQGGQQHLQEELGVSETAQLLPRAKYEKLWGNLHAQVQISHWGEAICDIQKSDPQMSCSHSNMPHVVKPLGMILFKRKTQRLVFYSWIFLSLSLLAKLR